MKKSKFNTGIYIIENKVNGKLYVGSAINLKGRFKNHKRDLMKNKHHCIYLQNVWNKYGEENFEFKPLLYCDKENLLFYEQRAINTYGIKNLYNISPTAGNILGVKCSEERKKKIGASNKGKIRTEEHRRKVSESLSGKNHPLYGKHPSEETIQKIREGNKGKKDSEETRRKKLEAMKGRKDNEEIRLKKSVSKIGEKNPMYGISPWNKGIPRTEEEKKKISKSLQGKKDSEETRRKKSEAKKGKLTWIKGKKQTEEHIKKRTEAVKKTWERKKAEKLYQDKNLIK